MIDQRQRALDLIEEHGGVRAASRATGIPYTTLHRRAQQDPAIARALDAVGSDGGSKVSGVWVKTDGYSVFLRPQDAEFPAFIEHVRETIGALDVKPPRLPQRPAPRDGRLLVLDPADVHIGKLCVAEETGYHYDAEIAEHRLVEGCRELLEWGVRNGAGHVLFVIGNDIAHIDQPHRKTTSGTPQDTDGTIFSIHRAATRAYDRVVRTALDMGLGVQIMFNPSNHDWVLGFTIAQVLAARYADHPSVTVSEYSVSERHRKYLRYGSNLIGLTHGDGAKEKDLPQIMMAEARPHIGECRHLYWYVHHYHHKVRKALGVRSMLREKEHVAMHVVQSGAGAMEGDNVAVEYVRSPSAPDGWHDRNGYIGRQAVEAFLHDARDGQCGRWTVWF